MAPSSAVNTKPGLIVFDLDYTLWPLHVDSYVTPPFSKKGSDIVDVYGKKIKPFPEVTQVLEYLKSEGIPMAVASRTTEIEGAGQLVHLFGWDKYFDQKEIYPGCKLNHFKVFEKKTNLPYSRMMFFDDEQRNILDVGGLGVYCVYVLNGVTMKLVKDHLSRFAQNAESQS